MVVEVRLFASFREGRFKEKKLELPEGSSLSDLLVHLKIRMIKSLQDLNRYFPIIPLRFSGLKR